MQTDLQLQNKKLKRLNQELTQSLRNYERLFQEAPVAYVLVDDTLKITRFNNKAVELFETENLLKKLLTQFVSREDRDNLICHIQELLQRKYLTVCTLDFLINGSQKHFRVFSELIIEGSKNIVCCAIIDETSEVLYRKEIEELSNRDQLTGLYNRRFFTQQLANLREEGRYPIGFIMADLNGLKLVNDAFGHAMGDQMIKQSAKAISSVLNKNYTLVRFGGDEFGILAPGADIATLKRLLVRLENVTRSLTVGFMSVSVSFGYSQIVDRDHKSLEAITEAETRMFRNKLTTSVSQRHIMIASFLTTLHQKFPGEARHSERVGQLMQAFGHALDYDNPKCLKLKTAGLMHDIGKIALDQAVIVKSSGLNKAERQEIERHPEIGFRILSSTTSFADIAEIVLTHHERIDGKGYPRKLTEPYIGEEARMLAISEAYEAMTSGRSYKKALSEADAVAALEKGAGTQFDQRLVQVFIEKVIKIHD